MKRRLLYLAALAAWLISLGWLVRKEAFPEWFTGISAGYRGLIGDDVLLSDSWMRILINGKPAGYSHTLIELDEQDPAQRTEIASRIRLRLTLMGEAQTLSVDTTAHLDLLSELQNFSFDLSARSYSLRLTARRVEGDRFHAILKTGSHQERFDVTIPRDAVIHSPLTELAIGRLKPGEDMAIKTFDPTTLQTAILRVRALRREPLSHGGATVQAMALALDYQGIGATAWVDPEGRVLRQETPFGWTMEACTMDEATAALDQAGAQGDLLAEMAVPLNGTIRHPRATSALTLRLTGVPFEPGELDSARQTATPDPDGGVRLESRPARWPAQTRDDANQTHAPADLPAALEPWLAPSPFVQSDLPSLRAQAAAIVAGADTPVARARAIHRWVHANIRKDMTISLPSAAEVLASRRGDCNEHTVLFVALARAAGLPARAVVGLALHEGAFYYHAWPAVHVGAWVEMDPTWDQELVDATHLAFATGELAEQVRIARIMGRLRITVLHEAPSEGNAP